MIETELRASVIEGVGTFLMEDVRAGQLIWRFDSRVDQVFSTEALDSLPYPLRTFLLRYTTYHRESGLRVLCGDHGRHFNHSDTPNTMSLGIGFGDDVAAHDMAAGTVLTTDYRSICDDAQTGQFGFDQHVAPPRRAVSAVCHEYS